MVNEKRNWEPKEGDTVYVSSGGFRPTFTERKVARLTLTQIVLDPLYAGGPPARFRRGSGHSYSGDYPSFEQVGGRDGYGRRGCLYHPQSQNVLNALSEGAREERVNAVLEAQDDFRYHRDAERAKALQGALNAFLEWEEDPTGLNP